MLCLKTRDHCVAARSRDAILHLSRIRKVDSYALKAASKFASCLLMMQLIHPALRFIDRAFEKDP
jgi:hypothetical protein